MLKNWLENEPKITFICAVVSAVSLILSITGALKAIPVDPAWIAIVLCGVPILVGAFRGVVFEHDIKADLLVSIALVAFFVAIIDGNKIDRVGMDASESGIIEAVLLPKVVEDYKAVVDGKSHRYGCSGIDGVSFGPAFGKTGGEKFLTVAYGIYGDTTRTDNDSQILHQYSMDSIRTYKEVFSQDNMPKDGPAPTGEFFVHTGNTTYGVQNLCWDPDSKNWLMFVYRGKKSAFPNGTLYIADGRKAPVPDAEGKMTVPLVDKGCYHEERGIHYW